MKAPRLRKNMLFIVLAIIFFILLVFFVRIFLLYKGVIFGVPYEFQESPKVNGDHEFSLQIEIPCNRFFDREIGFLIDPPVEVKKMKNTSAAVSGNAHITLNYGEGELGKSVSLSESGSHVNSVGVWRKRVYSYPSEGIFCESQSISLEVESLNFSLSEHDVTVYISRDRRP